MTTAPGQLKTVLILDGDKTLAPQDTGELFWNTFQTQNGIEDDNELLKSIFSSNMGYSYTAFRQATLQYEPINEKEFEIACEAVARDVAMYAEFVALLHRASRDAKVGAIVVTCGLRRIWEKIIEKEPGLSGSVLVIGGGRIDDGIVVTAAVKTAIVTHLQDHFGAYVWAFGDSILDLEMLKKADQAVVVVGELEARSKSMDAALSDAIAHHELRAHQVLLPTTASPRLEVIDLPVIDLKDSVLPDSIFRDHDGHQRPAPPFLKAADNVAKLLTTPTRDARVSGHALREAHHRAGYHLATTLVSAITGLEEYQTSRVQGNSTSGYRFKYEENTIIVALLRGGEPMALGVSEAMSEAMFVHAKEPADLSKENHIHGRSRIVLVDWVINTSAEMNKFICHIRATDATIHIIIVAGVIQEQCMRDGAFARLVAHDVNLNVAALRTSENKYTGTKGVDTGNRLFNTTHLE